MESVLIWTGVIDSAAVVCDYCEGVESTNSSVFPAVSEQRVNKWVCYCAIVFLAVNFT